MKYISLFKTLVLFSQRQKVVLTFSNGIVIYYCMHCTGSVCVLLRLKVYLANTTAAPHSCEYEQNEMHHIHESAEILFVENGSADYYVEGKKYYVEKGDILIIGYRKHHMRRLDKLPFLRYRVSNDAAVVLAR